MARVDGDALLEPEQILITASLREARTVEELLTGCGVDYAVQVELLAITTLFGSRRNGAAFYVTAPVAAECRARLRAAGLSRRVVEEPNP
jgi:hypothetical protein